MSSTDITPQTDPNREDAVGRRVAEEVAVSESMRANRESRRADVNGAAAVANSIDASNARSDRDAAVTNSVIATEEARGAGFGTWLMLGIIAIVLMIGIVWFVNRPADSTSTTTVINREVPIATPAAAQDQPPVTIIQNPPATAAPAAPANVNVNVTPPQAPEPSATDASPAPPTGDATP